MPIPSGLRHDSFLPSDGLFIPTRCTVSQVIGILEQRNHSESFCGLVRRHSKDAVDALRCTLREPN